ncbi:MAG: HEAT repeat domain-containing protein [Opitutaceae bacterium]|nr:HEAT repeat domain-containing protein [Opitutaceae bacterium]MBP9912462.1 HEAT repeat domain-containing protein [Opitutaceae bacterium]
MNCTQAQDRFAELLDRRLEATASGDVRTHLAACPDCQREFATLSRMLASLDALPAPRPGPRLRANFYALLEEEKHAAANLRIVARRRRVSLWRWVLSPIAACALLAAGFFAGQRHAPVTTAPAPINPGNSEATTRELAALRLKVDSMSQLVGYSLLQQQPAGERLQGILAAQDLTAPSDTVITQLISALALDPSTNVRLSALEALYPHANQEVVRAGVLASLTREQNPLVQVSMIDFLVATRDRAATSTLEQLSRTDKVDRSVRDAAKRALVQL